MRRGRSTGKPTAEEAAWIVAVKEGPCMACYVWTKDEYTGCDAHHLLMGGRRIGHMATIGLCKWHHVGQPDNGVLPRYMREDFGPSLMDGSKLFHEAYGSDEELLAMQKEFLGYA